MNKLLQHFTSLNPFVYIKENYNNNDSTNRNTSIMGIITFILFLYALYLSFKCNNGVNVGSLLLACCCSPCYVAYRLAQPC